ncbi:hypothetical protein OB236_11135 [Paenibacillus sp. WQ 127069]|uniref:Uncharacterized protein n=1 Tax=Paenibacillus baimaensis TaxID=2982185 RepID=A0ABT2UDE8_9BACL|nr:hypothetical protein [Paenibacillus sp. WQ 127069]MCU6792673.1 hypothetical protein [Paenibacillus sp. WQ 127069]
MRNKKSWMAAILSTALLFGGSFTLTTKAYADDDSEIVTVKPPVNIQHIVSDWRSQLLSKSYAITNTDRDYLEFHDALADGQTLAVASGLSSKEFSNKMTTMAEYTLDQVSQAFTISNEQMNTLRMELYKEIESAATVPGYTGAAGEKSFDFNAVLQQRLEQIKTVALGLSNEEFIDIKNRLDEGQPIAVAARINEADLINSLANPVLQKIEEAVNRKWISSEEGSKLANQAMTTIGSTVKKTDLHQASKFNTARFLKEHLQSVVTAAYLVSSNDDLDFQNMQQAYKAGATLTQLTGLSVGELASRIVKLWEPELAELPENARNDVLQQALNLVTQSVSVSSPLKGQ